MKFKNIILVLLTLPSLNIEGKRGKTQSLDKFLVTPFLEYLNDVNRYLQNAKSKAPIIKKLSAQAKSGQNIKVQYFHDNISRYLQGKERSPSNDFNILRQNIKESKIPALQQILQSKFTEQFEGNKLSDNILQLIIDNPSVLEKAIKLADLKVNINYTMLSELKDYYNFDLFRNTINSFVRDYLVTRFSKIRGLEKALDEEINLIEKYMTTSQEERVKLSETVADFTNMVNINIPVTTTEINAIIKTYTDIAFVKEPVLSAQLGISILRALHNMVNSREFKFAYITLYLEIDYILKDTNIINEFINKPGFAKLLYKIISNLKITKKRISLDLEGLGSLSELVFAVFLHQSDIKINEFEPILYDVSNYRSEYDLLINNNKLIEVKNKDIYSSLKKLNEDAQQKLKQKLIQQLSRENYIATNAKKQFFYCSLNPSTDENQLKLDIKCYRYDDTATPLPIQEIDVQELLKQLSTKTISSKPTQFKTPTEPIEIPTISATSTESQEYLDNINKALEDLKTLLNQAFKDPEDLQEKFELLTAVYNSLIGEIDSEYIADILDRYSVLDKEISEKIGSLKAQHRQAEQAEQEEITPKAQERAEELLDSLNFLLGAENQNSLDLQIIFEKIVDDFNALNIFDETYLNRFNQVAELMQRKISELKERELAAIISRKPEVITIKTQVEEPQEPDKPIRELEQEPAVIKLEAQDDQEPIEQVEEVLEETKKDIGEKALIKDLEKNLLYRMKSIYNGLKKLDQKQFSNKNFASIKAQFNYWMKDYEDLPQEFQIHEFDNTDIINVMYGIDRYKSSVKMKIEKFSIIKALEKLDKRLDQDDAHNYLSNFEMELSQLTEDFTSIRNDFLQNEFLKLLGSIENKIDRLRQKTS